MKKILFLFSLLVTVFLGPGTVFGQDKPTVEISTVKHNGKNVDFTLKSSKPFIFGNNRYYLYIGDKEFFLSTQSHNDGKGLLTIFIPRDEFKELKDGESMYLTYGHIFRPGSGNRDQIAQVNRRCWSLGAFSKKLLTK